MDFEIVGRIEQIETIDSGGEIPELSRLNRIYGNAKWCKNKGICTVRLKDNSEHKAEVHWYEANAMGRKEYKIKRYID